MLLSSLNSPVSEEELSITVFMGLMPSCPHNSIEALKGTQVMSSHPAEVICPVLSTPGLWERNVVESSVYDGYLVPVA